MKTVKQVLALFLTFLLLMTTSVFAAYEETEVDFSYAASLSCFMSEDLARISIDLYGEAGTQGNINTECYIPVYHADSNQLVDVFHLPIQLENPFADSSWYSYIHEIRITDSSIQNYRIKVLMLDSLETLSPEGTVQAPYSNEFTASNADYYKFVQFDGIIPYAPFYSNETTVTTEIIDNVELFEGAYDAGYTEDDFSPGASVSIVNQYHDLYKVQGLYCRVMINIANDGTYQMRWAEPIQGYNDTVSIKPVNLVSAGTPGGDVEFYYSETDTEPSYLPLSETISVYQNYQTASYSGVVPGHSDTVTEYQYVDTDMDGLYDTVYIVYEEVFVVGATYASSNRIYADTTAMTTYNSASLKLDPDDFYTSYALNVDFETITAGQIVKVRPSYDGIYTHYDVTVMDPEIIYGEISKVYTQAGITYYQIGNQTYRMLRSDAPGLLAGDSISGFGYGDIILGYEYVVVADMGVILNTQITTDFDTEYQIQILNQNGETVAYNLADKVNGSTPYYNASSLTQSFPVGDIIVYQLNDSDEIVSCDVQTGYVPLYANVLTSDDKMTSEQNTYRLSSNKLGSYYLTENTLIFATDAARTEITEDNLILANNFTFLEDVTYSYSLVYNADKEAIVIVVYETEIITEDSPVILDEIHYGMVVNVGFNDTFEREYQIQVLTPFGLTLTYSLAYRVNGEVPNWSTTEEMLMEFQKGDIIAYQLNSNEELARYDVETSYDNTVANVLDSSLSMASGTNYYRADTQTIGDYSITASTVIFDTGAEKEYITQSIVSVAELKQLMDESEYSYSVLYDENNDAKVIVLENADLLCFSEYPFVITKKATIKVDSVDRTKYFGYIDGEEQEFLAAENGDTTVTSLEAGDICNITFIWPEGITCAEIIQAEVLVEKTDEGFQVIDNAMSGAYDDGKAAVVGKYVTLSTADYGTVTTFAAAKTAAAAMMSVGSSVSLEGFGAAGKAYSVGSKTIRLINANNYALTFDGTTTERYYTDRYEDDRISDYYVDINALAYCYNAKTERIEVTSALNAETDNNTMDYHYADQLENDDLIYVYQHDGETKLIFIVDVKGDTY